MDSSDQSTGGAARALPVTEPFRFHGKGGEFFGIVFVNGLLVMLTLGIYSPWAKVRALQYLYGNTELAGGSFQFTADPKRMLISRLIAVALFAVFIALENIGTTEALIAYFLMSAAFVLVSPVLTVLMLSFRLRFSAWRGINFRFNKDYRGAYRVYMAPILVLLAAALSLLLPANSEKVEDFLGMERYQSHSGLFGQDETLSECGPSVITPDDIAGASSETSPVPADFVYMDEPVYVEETSADDDAAYAHEVVYVDEAGYADEEAYADGELYAEEAMYVEEPMDEYDTYQPAQEADLTRQYVNPYFFIPAGVFVLIFLLLLPYFDFISVRFMVRNVRFGGADFSFDARARAYYQVYFRGLLGAAALATGWVVYGLEKEAFAALLPALVIASVLFLPLIRAYFKSARYNLALNHTAIAGGDYRLAADVPLWWMFWILVTNTLLVILSFGLMRAWAQVRTQRFMLSHTRLDANESLESFIARQEQEQSAFGEEMADVFDLDVAF